MGVGDEATTERVLATVLFTDIAPQHCSVVSAIRRGAICSTITTGGCGTNSIAPRGREIDTTGDGFLAVFDSASRAVQCGLAMIVAARAMGISIRVGIHTGEVEVIGTDARGVAVHVAARVLARAGSEEVLVTSTTRDLLEGSGVTFEDAGAHEL